MDANHERMGRGRPDSHFKSNLLARILFGLILGAVAGMLLAKWGSEGAIDSFIDHTHFFGDLFIRLLNMIVVPVVFFSLVCGAASIAPSRLGRVGFKILVYYILTSAAAVIIGLFLANLVKPGFGFHVSGGEPTAIIPAEPPTLSQVFLEIVPSNPVASLAAGNILPIIFFAIVFGVSMSLVKDSPNPRSARAAEALYEIFTAAAETMYKIVTGIMQYAPIGVFVLISNVFAKHGSEAIGPLMLITLTVYMALAAHLLLCYGGCLSAFGLSLATFLKKSTQPMITAFVTRSSSGTLPVTLQVAEEDLGAPRSIASFSLPLGATINMDGTAIYLGVCAMFIGYAVDKPLTFDQQAMVVITATLASIGTAGVPGAGAIMLLMVMDSIGMGVIAGTSIAAAYAMILGIDALLDMGRTALNVTGDLVGTVIIAKTEKSLEMRAWE